MQLKEMYSGAVNSEETFISSEITASDTIIYVHDGVILPDAPNVLVIGGNLSNAETVRLIEKQGNKLTVQRAFQGVAQEWAATTVIARNYTEYDHGAFIFNIKEINAELKSKAGIVLMQGDIPITERKQNTFYLKVTDVSSQQDVTTNVTVSPTMGIKIVD